MKITRDSWIYAQQAVLGSCLIEARCIGSVMFDLTEDDFAPQYRPMFRAMVDLYATGKNVDPVVIVNAIGDEYRETVMQLMEITPTAANAKRYAQITAEQAKVLRIREMGTQLQTVDSLQDAHVLMDSANGAMVTGKMKSSSLKDVFLDFFDRYNKNPDYYDWFIPQLRKMIRMENGTYMVIGARPSVGKSAFAAQAALYWAAACGLRVGFYSSEMKTEDVTDRIAAMAAGISMSDIQERRVSDREINGLAAIAARISEAPLFIADAAGHSIDDIKADAMQNHFDVVIIDYLQIVPGKGDDEFTRVSNISRQLQQMCKQTKVNVLALSQLKRIKGARPGLEDLRSSGQIEQDADIITFLHRTKDGQPDVEFIISKNRQGTLGTTRLSFDGPRQQFLYIGKGDKPMKPFDYGSFTFHQPPDPDHFQQMEMLPDDTPVPFDT